MRRIALLTSLLLAACGPSAHPSAGAPSSGGGEGGAAPAAGQGRTAEIVAELPPFPEEPFRAEIPKPGPDRPFQLPPVKRFSMGPAIDVYLIEDHTLPVVSLDLNLDGGSINDPAGKVGLASTCMSMITEGTARLDKIAYSEALADIASNISAFAGRDRQGVSMSSLKRNLPATFALFTETITSPGFRQSDFDRMIKRSLESLKQAKASPGSINGRVSGTVLYGGSHPLGRVHNERTLAAITLVDCKRYHAAYLKPKAARLFVTGDITQAEIEETFKPLLAAWKGAPKRSAAIPGPKPPTGKVFFVHVPNAAQSSVSMIHFGP
jgi:zinc protease